MKRLPKGKRGQSITSESVCLNSFGNPETDKGYAELIKCGGKISLDAGNDNSLTARKDGLKNMNDFTIRDAQRLVILNAEISETQDKLDVLIGKLETANQQRSRLIEEMEKELIRDAVNYPTFIGIDENEASLQTI